MARPRQKHEFVYRVLLDRPKSKDSIVRWTHVSLGALKQKYGDRLLQVEEYQRVRIVHDSSRVVRGHEGGSSEANSL